MTIVENKNFEKVFPLEVTGIMNDIVCFMNYKFMIRFRPIEKDIIWQQIKALNIDADQVAIDSNGYEYIGW